MYVLSLQSTPYIVDSNHHVCSVPASFQELVQHRDLPFFMKATILDLAGKISMVSTTP
jgi:hypothetical protein